MSSKLDTSKKEGAHALLNKLTGDWSGTTKVWFEPDKVADDSPVTGSIRPLMDGRFMLHEYKGSFGGKPLEGFAIYGYHLDLKKFQSAWIDSFHNGSAIMFSEGQRDVQAFSVLGSFAYVTPEEEQNWGWRTEIRITNDDEVKITAYNISPAGEEAKATETIYHRSR